MNNSDRALMEQMLGVVKPPEPQEVSTPVPDPVPAQAGATADDTLASILKACGADKDAALARCDVAAQAFFDASKVSKVDAAARGIDRTEHNKTLWQQAQNLRSSLKAGVRKHYNARTVAAKVTRTSAKAADKADAGAQELLEQFMSTPAFQALFTEFTNQQKGK